LKRTLAVVVILSASAWAQVGSVPGLYSQPITVVHARGGITPYGAGSATPQQRGSAFVAACQSLQCGDHMYLTSAMIDTGMAGGGTACGNAQCVCDLSVNYSCNATGNGASVTGDGTVILNATANGILFHPGSGSVVEGVYPQWSGVGGFWAAWGANDTDSTLPFTGAVVKGMQLTGGTDGIYVRQAPGGSADIRALTCNSGWDCLAFFDTGALYRIYDSHLYANGTYVYNLGASHCLNAGDPAIPNSTTVIEWYNTTCVVQGGTAENFGIRIKSGVTVKAFSGEIDSFGTDAYDLVNDTDSPGTVKENSGLVWATSSGTISPMGNPSSRH
jgi:hypothetical protein